MYTKDLLDSLSIFQNTVDLAEMKEIFGALGGHLWQQYQKEENLLNWWALLSYNNKMILAGYLNEHFSN